MKTIINFIKRLPRLFKKDKKLKLSVAQIEELIKLNDCPPFSSRSDEGLNVQYKVIKKEQEEEKKS